MATQKVSDTLIDSFPSSKLTGALPAIDGSAITGAGDSVTKSASDPAINTNPSGGVSHVWVNTTSGEMYACTDATTDANVWTNIGAGDGDVIPYNWGGTSYGYVVGGYNVYHGIDRFSLASGTNNTVIGTVTTIAFGHATYGYHANGGSSSDTHIYGVGGQGWHGGNHIWQMVAKIAMASSADLVDHHDLDLANGDMRSCNNRTHAYHPGGDGYPTGGAHNPPGLGPITAIQKTTYATDVSSTNVGVLPVATAGGGSVSDAGADYGYRNGVYTSSTAGTLQKFSFTNDVDASNIGTLTYNKGNRTQSNGSDTHGYATGGNASDVIESFLFSNEATQTDVGNLESGLDYGSACSSTTYGYVMAGTGTDNAQRIQRFSFASQTENSSQTSLSGQSWGQSQLSNGQE